MNLNPFAEDMIAIAGDIEYGLGETHIIYLRSYTSLPEVETLDLYAAKVRRLVRGTIAYSIEVVTLAESKQSGSEKSKALAEYLDGLLRPVLSKPVPPLNITLDQLDTLVVDVGEQKNFLDALGAAQPIIDEVARVAGELFEETKDALNAMILAVQVEIDEDISPIVDADALLRSAQIETTFNFRFLKAYRLGDQSALDSLFVHEPSLHEFETPNGQVSAEFMSAVEERMATKLAWLRDVRDQLRPDVELYWQQQEELERIAASYNKALRQARVAVLAWARAHARLAAGITSPAEIDLMGLARKAAGSAVPVP